MSKKHKLDASHPGVGKSKIMKKLAKKLNRKYADVKEPTPTSWYGRPFGVGKSAIMLDDVKTEPVQPRSLKSWEETGDAEWEAKLIDGYWRIGVKGRFATLSDSIITVHRRDGGNFDGQWRTAEAIVREHNQRPKDDVKPIHICTDSWLVEDLDTNATCWDDQLDEMCRDFHTLRDRLAYVKDNDRLKLVDELLHRVIEVRCQLDTMKKEQS